MIAAKVRPALAFSHDVVVAGAAWLAAYWLRFNFDIPAEFRSGMWQMVGWIMVMDALLFWRFGLYRGLWRYASIHDLRLIVVVVGVAALILPASLVLARPAFVVPRSVFVLHPLLLVFFMGGSRLLYRAWKERHIGKLGALNGKPVLILGAGDAAVSLLRDLAGSAEWRVIGLLDDDATMHGRQIMGASVLGRISDLALVAERFAVDHAIIAMPSVSHSVRRKVVSACQEAKIRVLTVPSFEDLMGGKVTVSQIREVELDDLLGRDPVVLDTAGLNALLGGQVVLVSGAGGSIGSELCRQLARFSPSELVLLDASEFALYQVEQEFLERYPQIPIVCIIGDVKDPIRVDAVVARHRPRIVFHAAAYKHVPLLETDNAWEAVRNNVGGTHVLGEAALRHGVEKFVLVSTDKAVKPTNVMGASKRMAEMVCQALQVRGGTQFVIVRFGNVLGSTGSVIPRFRHQISQGGPVTVTHPDITRYFMSIPEAAQLVLQAGMMGKGGEIFVLEMGEPVRIVDLARDMIRLSGLNGDDIKIVFTGLRPGEKLFEELLADGEMTLPTQHEKLRISRSREVTTTLLTDIEQLLSNSRQPDEQEAREVLKRWVDDFTPATTFTSAAKPTEPGRREKSQDGKWTTRKKHFHP
ncbi:MAG: polysaccharide biosynthesis protein [Burkholderiales bacterium]